MGSAASIGNPPEKSIGRSGALPGPADFFFIALSFATVLYVWVAAVRAAPAVRRRKKAARAAWRGRDRRGRVGA